MLSDEKGVTAGLLFKWLSGNSDDNMMKMDIKIESDLVQSGTNIFNLNKARNEGIKCVATAVWETVPYDESKRAMAIIVFK